ncbi:MAG: hypothetical protein QF662_03815, partial [Phycisphaerae bacterium]|nr:hypothetical protein [Phycisphaerae bacterium]
MFNRKWLSVIAFALMIITLQASVHSQIFVPRPKGDNDSLDSDPLSEAQDRVFLVSGDRVSGMVADILPEGVVRIVNPIFKEPLLVRLNGIRNIQLSGKDKVLDGPDSVALTNGNRVRGAVRQITAGAVIVLTKSMGTVSIKRTMVRSIDFHVAREVLLDTDFSSGSTGAWKHKTGSWRVQNNKYYSLSPNGWTYAEVSQRGPTTLAWTLSGQLSGYVTFAFFANSSASYWGGSSIAIRFSRSYVHIYQVTRNSTRTIASKPLGRS